MTVSSLEDVLTHHIRHLLTTYISTSNLKLLSFITSLISCLFVGAILTISIYTPYFITELQYTQLQINLIGSFISVGMYLPLPLLGYLADYHGPVLLSVISLFMLSPGYYLVATVYENSLEFMWILFAFFLIGCGTSSLYFTCLLTCAKMYPRSKGLSITGPITCYGLSSFIISELILNLSYLHTGEMLDIVRIFKSLSILFIVLSLLNWISASIVTIDKKLLFDENTQLLDNPTSSHSQKFKSFLHDKSMYLLLMSLLLCIGPLESFIINISSFSDVLDLSNSQELLKFSICSTLARIGFGLILEVITANLKQKLIIIIIILIIQFLGSIATFTSVLPQYISSIFGIAYGGLFTVYPTILANIWGVDIFGSTWGLFMLAPLFGSILFGLLYGAMYDLYCEVHTNEVWNCLYSCYSSISVSLVLAMSLVIIGWKFWWSCREGN